VDTCTVIAEVTHNDIMMLVIIFGVIGILGLGFLGWMARDVSRITRAVGTLVIQETAKLRRD
jgi:hypothetical protein